MVLPTAPGQEVEVKIIGSTQSEELIYFDNMKLTLVYDNIDVFVADIASYSDYYPGGMAMPGRQANPGNYRFPPLAQI